jgi:hypothetical protein
MHFQVFDPIDKICRELQCYSIRTIVAAIRRRNLSEEQLKSGITLVPLQCYTLDL